MTKLAEVLTRNEAEVLSDWMKEQTSTLRRRDLIGDEDLRRESAELLRAMAKSAVGGNVADIGGEEWKEVRELLGEVSASRATQGFTVSETATFIFSLKKAIFGRLQHDLAKSPEVLVKEIWAANQLIDSLGMVTVDAFNRKRDQLIARQQEEMLELSTPVVKLWDGVLALPLIGTLDSNRTQVVMETLLTAIVESNSRVAIIDITGVPAVDTLVAQHLIKTITAARLMGADCIISGVRPQIAQTIVHLGINLSNIVTKAKLADALSLALQRTGWLVTKSGSSALKKSAARREQQEDNSESQGA